MQLEEEKRPFLRVWIKYGTGKIVVNGKPINEYFLRKIYSTILQDPLIEPKI